MENTQKNKWETEVENLDTGSDFLKLEQGQHSITFLDDGNERTATFDEKEQMRVYFKVKYNNKEFNWDISKGGTKMSLYGQIAIVGKKEGTLVGKTINVVVRGEGKNRNYTVLEAVEASNEQVE